MTRKNTTDKKATKKGTKKETKNPIAEIILFSASILIFCLVIIKGESLWKLLHDFVLGLFGISSILWGVLLLFVSISSVKGKAQNIKSKVWLASGTIILLCAICYVFFSFKNIAHMGYFEQLKSLYFNGVKKFGAGIIGGMIGIPFMWMLGKIGSRVIFVILLFVSVMLLTGTTLGKFLSYVKKIFMKGKEFYTKTNVSNEQAEMHEKSLKSEVYDETSELPDIDILVNDSVITDVEIRHKESKKKKNKKETDISEATEQIEDEISGQSYRSDTHYEYPPIDFLQEAEGVAKGDINNELKVNGQLLVDTLKSFNVNTKIVNISRGPTVTRYELQPAAGVKISKITNLADDIALSLAASGVRIEAPIPGKAAVGIEVPNKITNVVRMRELIDSKEFVGAKGALTVVLGKDISGKTCVTDLAKMPHLLIAGSTGSGKSVCINSFIISLFYKSSPDEVKLLMIDPKVVELGIYNGIPHLLIPVVTDSRKAAGALNWAVKEMENRYKMFAECNVRDISSYNKFVCEQQKNKSNKDDEDLKPMSQIVIIIDELADLMMVAPNEVEDAICRLAQMARAAGMHLVIATQRPSVDVITGIIKANIPSRIALAVSSQVDSRTILDKGGAEKLLGRGDMLFAPIGSSKPQRIQGCYVTDEEIESVIKFLKANQDTDYDEQVIDEIEKNAIAESNTEKNSDTEQKDEMLEDAIRCVMEAGQASTSFLQRKLRVGYARAGRLMDEMEQMGIVGPYEGSKPRKLLITYQQWLERNSLQDL